MASINLNTLKKQTTVTKQNNTQQSVSFTYSDLNLDLALGLTNLNLPVYQQQNDTDVKLSYDYAAVSNSIENIFNSMPGQWLLNPTFGIGLPRFLFSPIDSNTGNQIAETISQNLTLYEPRVTINKLQVTGDPDNNLYQIILALQLKHINNSRFILSGTLTNSSFKLNQV